MALTRHELVRLANEKLEDASLLLAKGRWASAYHLFGLSVELGLKAAIARRIPAETVQDKAFGGVFYSHDLKKLAGLADIGADLERRLGTAEFRKNWEIVGGWGVDSRYERVDESEARAMAEAVEARTDGVFEWLKSVW